MKTYAIVMLAALSLFGCHTPQQGYFDFTDGVDPASCPAVTIKSPPKIMPSRNLSHGVGSMVNDGYVPIGYTVFGRTPANLDMLEWHAAEQKAGVVLLYTKYSGRSVLHTPVTNFSTSSTSGNIGLDDINLNTYRTYTSWIPYVVHNYRHLAVYWVKSNAPIDSTPGCEAFRERINENLRLIGNSGITNSE